MILQPLFKQAKQQVLYGVEIKAFDPSKSTRGASLFLGFPHGYVAKHLILCSQCHLESLPISLCSSICAQLHHMFMLTQLQVFSLCEGMHEIDLNSV